MGIVDSAEKKWKEAVWSYKYHAIRHGFSTRAFRQLGRNCFFSSPAIGREGIGKLQGAYKCAYGDFCRLAERENV